MTLKIECSEPAYLATSTFLVQCALSLLVDFEAVPTRGVLTTASAFQRTRLIERLRGRGVTFDLLEG
ncbi:hypothetical protein TYRP_003582 [Tyrophagus putrescentiae]|nr:hypothetical protein TYRP_003582 [Tyrophagus putrescentiae]